MATTRPPSSAAAPSSPHCLSTRQRCGSPPPTAPWNTRAADPVVRPATVGDFPRCAGGAAPGGFHLVRRSHHHPRPCHRHHGARASARGGRGNRTEPWRCRAMVLGAGSTTRRGGLCRLGIDARHLNRSGPRQAVLDALDLALHHRRSRRPTSSPSLRRRRRAPNPPRVSWATGPRRCLRHVRYRREEATPADGLVGLPVEQRLSDAANHRSRNLPE